MLKRMHKAAGVRARRRRPPCAGGCWVGGVRRRPPDGVRELWRAGAEADRAVMMSRPTTLASGTVLTRGAVLRVLKDVVRAEVRRRRGADRGDWTDAQARAWNEGTRLGSRELDVDSIEMVAVGARVNEMFHLHESGCEESLLSGATLGDWADVVVASLGAAARPRLTFLTSGSTGVPKACEHEWWALAQEAEALAGMFGDRGRVVSFLPAHHLYGFMFTVMLAERLGVEVLEARGLSAGAVAREVGPGDLIVNYPAGWEALGMSVPRLGGAVGVCSTGPCGAGLWRRLVEQGLGRLVEIYGCTEHGGIGWRDDPRAALTLHEHWQRDDGAGAEGRATALRRVGADGVVGPRVELMDRLVFEGPGGAPEGSSAEGRRFRLGGRVDDAVKVGGINVFPSRVAGVLAEVPGVAEVAVRAARVGGGGAGSAEGERLKAFVVPVAGEDRVELEERLREHARVMLSAAERPVAWTFGERMPTGAMGKLADW